MNSSIDKELKMAEINKLNAETVRLQMEAEKLKAETLKIQKETKYYPTISIIIALIALVASILALLK